MEVDGREREIGGEAEGQAARQEETVAGGEQHGIGNAFDGQPALAGDHGVALDALMLRELDGHVADRLRSRPRIALRLEQRQHI